MSFRGYSLRCVHIARKAELLRRERTRDALIEPKPPGVNWVTRYIKRYAEVRAVYSRRYTHERAKCEDPVIVSEWFKLVQNVRTKYGISDHDIYSFDETDFMMEVSGMFRVITGSEIRSRPKKIEPGNREWVTVIETIAASGARINPLIVFSKKVHQLTWFKALQDPERCSWPIAVGSTGWTNNSIGLL